MSDDKTNKIFSKLKRRVSKASGPVSSGAESKKKFLRSQKTTKRFPSPSQWAHLPRLLGKLEKRAFAVASVIGMLSIVALGAWAYTTQLSIVPSKGGSYTEGLIGSPQFVNPLYSSTNDVDQDIARLVYSGLMKWDPMAGLIPDLAESYTISDDEKVYTFSLRSDATWHDGTPVTPRDVIFTFNALQSAEYRSPLAATYRGIAIEQVDERTISFTLDESFAPFLSTLTVGILPADYWADLDPQTTRLAERNLIPIGSGPYQFDELEKDKRGVIQSYTLKRYPKYYGGPAFIENITFKFYVTVEAAIDALKNKKIEGIAFAPKELIKDVTSSSTQIVSPSLPQITALFFNIKNGLVKDEDMRKALSKATDKVRLIDSVLNGDAAVTHTPVALGYTRDTATYLDPNPYNKDEASNELHELGWTWEDGNEFRTNSSGENLEMTIKAVNLPENIAVANGIVEQWKEVGIDTRVDAVEQVSFRADVLETRNYDILLSGILMGGDPDLYPFWHSSQIEHPGLNLSQFGNRKADEAIEEARTTSNIETRKDLYEEFAVIVNEVAPAVFLYRPTYTYITASKIHGIDLDSIVSPSDRFGQVNMWYIKSKRGFQQ